MRKYQLHKYAWLLLLCWCSLASSCNPGLEGTVKPQAGKGNLDSKGGPFEGKGGSSESRGGPFEGKGGSSESKGEPSEGKSDPEGTPPGSPAPHASPDAKGAGSSETDGKDSNQSRNDKKEPKNQSATQPLYCMLIPGLNADPRGVRTIEQAVRTQFKGAANVVRADITAKDTTHTPRDAVVGKIVQQIHNLNLPKKRKIAIIGSSKGGFYGAGVVRELKERGYRNVALVTVASPLRGAPVAEMTDAEIEAVEALPVIGGELKPLLELLRDHDAKGIKELNPQSKEVKTVKTDFKHLVEQGCAICCITGSISKQNMVALTSLLQVGLANNANLMSALQKVGLGLKDSFQGTDLLIPQKNQEPPPVSQNKIEIHHVDNVAHISVGLLKLNSVFESEKTCQHIITFLKKYVSTQAGEAQ